MPNPKASTVVELDMSNLQDLTDRELLLLILAMVSEIQSRPTKH